MEAHEIGRLVRAAREGDRAAFQAIYEHFVKRIYNFLFRMVGSADEAEDLTQQTFLQALRQLGRLRDAGQIESWIYRIARNEAYQKFRRKDADSWDDRDNERQMRKLREVRIHAQPDHNLMNAELGQVIQRVLDSLPAKLREVFVLAVIQGMSYPITCLKNRSPRPWTASWKQRNAASSKRTSPGVKSAGRFSRRCPK